jgi:hypothetical protein
MKELHGALVLRLWSARLNLSQHESAGCTATNPRSYLA